MQRLIDMSNWNYNNNAFGTSNTARFTVAEWLTHSPATPEVTGSRSTIGGISEIHISNRYSLRHGGTSNDLCGIAGLLWSVMSAVKTGWQVKSCLVIKMDRYDKYQTKQYTPAHTTDGG